MQLQRVTRSDGSWNDGVAILVRRKGDMPLWRSLEEMNYFPMRVVQLRFEVQVVLRVARNDDEEL